MRHILPSRTAYWVRERDGKDGLSQTTLFFRQYPYTITWYSVILLISIILSQKGCDEIMVGSSAVIFIPDDTSKTGSSRPLMLSRVMGCPLLEWLANSLMARGTGRFFLVCHQRFFDEAKACFPKDTALTYSNDQDTGDLLHVFLSTADDSSTDVTVITGPALLIDLPVTAPMALEPSPSNVYHLDRSTLMAALDDQFDFLDFLRNRGQLLTGKDGAYGIKSSDCLSLWQPVLNQQHLRRLTKQGVEIWDYNNCYVDPSVCVGGGTVLMPGTILRGTTCIGNNCTIGPNSYLQDTNIGKGCTINSSQLYEASVGDGTTVGPFAYVRPNSTIGCNARIGNFVEIKNSQIGDGTKVSHLTYVGDSDVGQRVNFGCGTVTVNYDRAKKHRTTIGNDAFIGCNTNLIAPITVGEGGYTAAGATITENVPDYALAIARPKQINKKDWAKRHKL